MAALADDLRLRLDPGELMRRAGMEPDRWQRQFLLSDARRIAILASRQVGKSESMAAKALHRAMFYPWSVCLVVSAAQRQAIQVVQKAKRMHAASPVVALDGDAMTEMRFANGSQLVALPAREATIRSFSAVALLVLDEAARIPDAVYASVRPFLAVSGGQLVLLSSAFGKRGFFWDAWSKGLPDAWGVIAGTHTAAIDDAMRYHPALEPAEVGSGWERFRSELAALGPVRGPWERYFVTADDVPRIPTDFLQEELESVGSWWWLQEWYGVFHDQADAVFSYDVVVQSISESEDAMSFGASDAVAAGELAVGGAESLFGGRRVGR